MDAVLHQQRGVNVRAPINVRTRNHSRRPVNCRATHPLVRELFRVIDATPIALSDVARLSGVNDATINAWRNGYRLPAIDKLDAVARVFGRKLAIVEGGGHGE
ncbi:hypothetical protein DKP76_07350 [Falsochrobactrum shanghaiense]|uniref:HTH cro/C1-type domain-containing protein n=1 Tax=Falsochrobactrum shanghaiense TaxID=2201899 RepID=A0A316JC62_9HYPH|nr:helix-turn-helix transcriptional regulator [Falsochrobactrum shanghaiense]PWL18868.1 hypothetical protein DKP76_07350 [Falsochrobactrum shanghaiense]